MNDYVELEATDMGFGVYAVRPKGQLGTCGFFPVPWTVQYIKAGSKSDATLKAVKIKRG